MIEGKPVRISNEDFRKHLVKRISEELLSSVQYSLKAFEGYLDGKFAEDFKLLTDLVNKPELFTKYEQTIWVNNNRLKHNEVQRVKNKFEVIKQLLLEEV